VTENSSQRIQRILEPGSCALLVIDMQNDFVSSRGKMAEFGFEISAVQQTVEPIRRLLETARAAGVFVVHTRVINDIRQNPPSWYAFWGEPAITIEASWGAQFLEELAPLAGELVITKYTYGAFHNTNLDTVLRQQGIQSIVVAGTDLNICAGDTMHQGFASGFHVVAVADCLACFTRKDAAHARALQEMGLYVVANHYGYVVGSDELVAAWQSQSGRRK
jgi:nicotinamidase-related amidase